MEALHREVVAHQPSAALLSMATHTPLGKLGRRVLRESEFVLIGGTNLVPTHPTFRQLWRITPQSASMRKFVLVGSAFGRAPNRFTAPFLRMILHPSATHSVRDQRTHDFLASHGFRSIMTGCVTTWSAPAPVAKPQPSAEAVVVLNRMLGQHATDALIVEGVRSVYPKVRLWAQAPRDLGYVADGIFSDDEVLAGGVDHLGQAFHEGADLITTRLHAGLFAMRHGVRTTVFLPRRDV